MSEPKLAIIIPTWNEAERLPACLTSILTQLEPGDRVVVADGGSDDTTMSLAERVGAEVIRCPRRGRGNQIAFALEALTPRPVAPRPSFPSKEEGVPADAVLIVHADAILAAGSLAAIRAWVEREPGSPGGCLGHRFDRRSPGLALVEWFDDRRARAGRSYGDQGQFFRPAALRAAGGFPDQPLMEDLELAGRLARLGPLAWLNRPMTVSARRFAKLGLIRTLLENLRFRRLYRSRGLAACERLLERYRRGE
jgi:glycosyltransferase involved in cell wall biosynthesis